MGTTPAPVAPYGVIYLVTCLTTGKHYVGQTTGSVARRWTNHKSGAKAGRGYLLGSAIQKHGVENFTIETVATAQSMEELNEKEISWIKQSNSLAPNGYNLKTGGSRGKNTPEIRAKIGASNRNRQRTPEERKAMGKAARERVWTQESREKVRQANLGKKLPMGHPLRTANLGRKQTPETIEKRRAKQVGRKHTPEAIEKMRRAATGRKLTPETKKKIGDVQRGRPGHPQSLETRAKISLARKGVPPSPQTIEASRAANMGNRYSANAKMAKKLK